MIGAEFLHKKLHQEYRWLTLPRVSHSSYKRPDHVIQIFNNTSTYILSIESKNFPKNIEPNIGPRLTGYIADLFSSSCNASRNINDTTNWSNTPFSLTTHSITHASAIAFLSGSTEAITKAEEISNSDLSFTVVLQNQEEILQIKSLTVLGTKILNILKSNINIFDSYNLQIKFIDS